jgi:hypothetical protein
MRRPDIAVLFLSARLACSVGGVPVPSAKSMSLLQQEQSRSAVSVPPGAVQSQDALAAAPNVLLKDGTPVQLKFVRKVVSSRVIAGEKLDLQVVDEVRTGEMLVIPRDSAAKAMVTMAQAKRDMGRGGNLEIKIESVRLASGETAPLRMTENVKGGGHKTVMIVGAIATGLVYMPAGALFFLVQGKDAVIPEGAEITAYVNGDVSLDPAKFTPAPGIPQAARGGAVQQQRNMPK